MNAPLVTVDAATDSLGEAIGGMLRSSGLEDASGARRHVVERMRAGDFAAAARAMGCSESAARDLHFMFDQPEASRGLAPVKAPTVLVLVTDDMADTGLGMSNLDHTIDEGMAEALQAAPGRAIGSHAAWNFHGRVYFLDGQFHEEVWVYGAVQGTVSAPTLRELMTAVNDRFGHD